jgi:AraC-like DNA-binding protein
MPYVEFPPAPQLAHLVKCVWIFEAGEHEAIGRPERIVPDGNPELVVHFGDPFGALAPGRGFVEQPRAFLMGQMTQPVTLESSRGRAGVMGVRFHAAGARAALGAAMDEFTDGALPVDDFHPGAASPLFDAIACAASAAERAIILQRFVARLAAKNARYQDPTVASWTGRIGRTKGLLGITELAAEAGISVRQLERRFLRQVGVAPRQYANVIRFRRVFDLLKDNGRTDWAHLASGAGYFDQPHMIRDFKRFLGCTPTQFAAQLRGLSAVMIGLDEETGCRVVTRRETRGAQPSGPVH